MQRILSATNNLAVSHPELMDEWDPSNEADPGQVLPGAHLETGWICGTCGNHWTMRVDKRTTAGQGCPACADHYRHFERGINDLPTLLPHLAPQWSATNPRDFSEYTATARREVAWHCDVHGTDWAAKPYRRALGYGNCPALGSKRRDAAEQVCVAAAD